MKFHEIFGRNNSCDIRLDFSSNSDPNLGI